MHEGEEDPDHTASRSPSTKKSILQALEIKNVFLARILVKTPATWQKAKSVAR